MAPPACNPTAHGGWCSSEFAGFEEQNTVVWHSTMPINLLTSDFDFELPPERIAQKPVEPRDHARLLHVAATLSDHHVYDLPHLLRAGDVLVLNDTKVIPARLYGARGTVKAEVLPHKKEGPRTWRAFAKPEKDCARVTQFCSHRISRPMFSKNARTAKF